MAFPPWKCSWPLLATVGSLVALILVSRTLLSPYYPTAFSGGSRDQILCTPVNATVDEIGSERSDRGSSSAPADSHGAVAYRGAPWMPEIGRWLSSCDSDLLPIDVVEAGLIGDDNWQWHTDPQPLSLLKLDTEKQALIRSRL